MLTLLSFALGFAVNFTLEKTDIYFTEPEEGLIFSLYNVDFPYSRLSHFRHSCGFWNGVTSQDQLWKLVKSEFGNGYFLQNVQYPSDRFAYNSWWRSSYCYGGPMLEDQAWILKPTAVNSTKFKLHNAADPACRLYNWKDGKGYTSCEKTVDHDLFRLRSPFAAADGGPMYRIAGSFHNELDSPVEYTFRFQTGFTKAIADSVAVSTTFSATISLTVWAMMIFVGFTKTQTRSISASVAAAFQRSTKKEYLREETIEYTIPPGKHVCLYQATTGIIDTITGTNFGFRANEYKLKYCGEGHEQGVRVSWAELQAAGSVLKSS